MYDDKNTTSQTDSKFIMIVILKLIKTILTAPGNN